MATHVLNKNIPVCKFKAEMRRHKTDKPFRNIKIYWREPDKITNKFCRDYLITEDNREFGLQSWASANFIMNSKYHFYGVRRM